MATLMILYVASGVLLALLSVPLILGRIPPNHFYGFRVQATLKNRQLWYSANRYAGWRLLVVGLISIVAGVALSRIPRIGVESYALACLGVVAVGLTVALGQSVQHVKSFAPPRSP